ncbi:MAG: DUF2971 domain-containing protein [Clostridiales bacterium]|nr:DUF2971 domain-containing protein [Candidatus Crickella equi]
MTIGTTNSETSIFPELNKEEYLIIRLLLDCDGITKTFIGKELNFSREKVNVICHSLSRQRLINMNYDGSIIKYYIPEYVRELEKNKRIIIRPGVHKLDEVLDTLDLRDYLANSVYGLNVNNNLMHYTSLDTAREIIEGGYIFATRHNIQNDGYEPHCYSERRMKHLYSSSFMLNNSESIAMWSIYAMDREGHLNQGVRLSLDGKAFKEWANSISNMFEVDLNNRITGEKLDGGFKSEIHKVAYSDIDDNSNNTEHNVVVANNSIRDVSESHEMSWNIDEYDDTSLAGYVKDAAWSYEKEVRLRVETYKDINADTIAIKIPMTIRDQIKVMTNPWFDFAELSEKNKIFLNSLSDKRVSKSKFTNKIFLKSETIYGNNPKRD